MTSTIDPLGGSYFVEALTDELERQALRLLRPHRRARRHGRRRSSTTSRSARSPTPPSSSSSGSTPGGASSSASTATASRTRRRCRSCASTRPSSASRSAASRPSARRATPGRWSTPWASSAKAATSDVNLMPPLLDAARVHATEGEIVRRSSASGATTPRPRSSRRRQAHMKKLLAAARRGRLAGTALFAIPALAATKTVSLKDDKFAPKSRHGQEGHDAEVRLEGQAPAQRRGHAGAGEVPLQDADEGLLQGQGSRRRAPTGSSARSTPGMNLKVRVK